jgi:hypothetical protein
MGSTMFQSIGTAMDSWAKFGAQVHMFNQQGGILGHLHTSGTLTDFNVRFDGTQPNTWGKAAQYSREILNPFSFFTNRAAEQLAS